MRSSDDALEAAILLALLCLAVLRLPSLVLFRPLMRPLTGAISAASVLAPPSAFGLFGLWL